MRLLLLLFLFPLFLLGQSGTASDIYGEAVRAYYSDDYRTAIKKYSEAITLKPNTIGYLYSRGLAYQKLYQDSLADGDFQAVIKLDHKYLDAWYQLGMVQIDEKHYDSAYGFFEQAQRISPNDIHVLHQVGLVLYYKRKYSDAVGVYNKIIALSPNDGQAYYKRGLANFNNEDYEEAIKDFSESYRIDPENSVALEQRALSFLRFNDLDNACSDWHLLLKRGNTRAQQNINTYCGK